MKNDYLKVTPEWKKSKSEIWDEHFEKLMEEETAPAAPLTVKKSGKKKWFVRLSMAAAVLFIAFYTVAYSYETKIMTAKGEWKTIQLPDHSSVKLNAESSLSYKPYFWFIKPSVKVSGEMFFAGEHTKGMSVNTSWGSVKVLGTSFNVIAREEKSEITCVTGEIEVSYKGEKLPLHPNQLARLEDGKFEVHNSTNTSSITAWTNGEFWFDNESLPNVIKEIERQYNVNIVCQDSISSCKFTGHFSKDKNLKEILSIIEKPFNIKLSLKE